MPTRTLQLKGNVQRLLNETTSPASAVHQDAADELVDLLLHDLRSPLAAICGYSQLMRRQAAGGQLEAVALVAGLQRIEAAARRIDGLLEELRRLPVLADSHGTASDRQPTDLVQLAQGVAVACEAARLGNCRVVVLSGVAELVGWWDPVCLERALANVIDNALKYNRDDRPVAVTVQRAEDWAVIQVADQGVGIPAAELKRVFERGYRASNVDSQCSGTGLGLVGVQDLVTEHGGEVELDSHLGIGTTITLRLPLGAPHHPGAGDVR
jgi:signal transduction histidine kinase